jgi:hypothetical protein
VRERNVDDEGRPFGISILGLISLLGGIVLVFVGVVLMGVVAFGPEPTGTGTFLSGVLTGAVGLLFIAVAGGFWFGFPWARIAGLVTALLGLAISAIGFVMHGSIAHAGATVVFPLFLLWYLNRASVKAAFTKQD